MRDRKVFGLLRLLTNEELDLFDAYLVSPLLEPSRTLKWFLAIWCEKILLPDREGQPAVDYSPEEFLAGSSLIPARTDKYCSHLHKKVLDFLAWRQYERSDQTRLELTILALEQRDAGRAVLETQREYLKSDIDEEKQSADKLLRELDFKWKDAEMRIHSRETHALWQEDFRGLHLGLDHYYRLQKLKLACASANARLIYNQTSDQEETGIEFLKELDHADAEGLLDPLSYAYWLTLKLYHSEEGDEQFQLLFAHLQVVGDDFARLERQEIFNYALNYCLRRGNRGETKYLRHSASLYRELLSSGIILEEGKLAPQAMKNIVVIHCLVGELDWVENFLQEYQDKLQGEFDPHIIKYNQAVLAFYRRDRKAIQLLKDVISQLKGDVFYELDSRTYLLKAFFEHLSELSIEELDEMYRMYDSFRIYISRNKMISSAHKSRYRNFITQFRRFLKLLEESPQFPDQKYLLALSEKIRSAEFMANKTWFLEKIRFYLGEEGAQSPGQ